MVGENCQLLIHYMLMVVQKYQQILGIFYKKIEKVIGHTSHVGDANSKSSAASHWRGAVNFDFHLL